MVARSEGSESLVALVAARVESLVVGVEQVWV